LLGLITLVVALNTPVTGGVPVVYVSPVITDIDAAEKAAKRGDRAKVVMFLNDASKWVVSYPEDRSELESAKVRLNVK